MKETKAIAKIISDTLSYTNGWHISDLLYQSLCEQIADKIIKREARKAKKK